MEGWSRSQWKDGVVVKWKHGVVFQLMSGVIVQWKGGVVSKLNSEAFVQLMNIVHCTVYVDNISPSSLSGS